MNDQQFDLDAIEARANTATPGPWAVSEDYSDVIASDGSQLASYWNPTSETRNGEFIAHARQDVPALLAEARRLRARVTELESDAALLSALQAAGVDNWEGYDDALAASEEQR